MTKYIDVDAAVDRLEVTPLLANDDYQRRGVIDLLVNAIPTADVVEVRHGEWVEQIKETLIPVEYDSNGDPILHKVIRYKCNLCGRIEGKKEPYCNCGAKMDGNDYTKDRRIVNPLTRKYSLRLRPPLTKEQLEQMRVEIDANNQNSGKTRRKG